MYFVVSFGSYFYLQSSSSSPPIISLKPSIVIPDPFSDEQAEKKSVHDDRLDQHVEDVLNKRQKLKRTLQGVGAFLKTRKLYDAFSDLLKLNVSQLLVYVHQSFL
jgi:hypothetical protein